MNRPIRTLWGLAAVGAATAVGVTTHEPGFVIITFIGGLWLPRILGLAGPGWRGRFGGAGGCGGHKARRRSADDRLEAWHRQAHSEAAPPASAASGATRV